MKEKIEPTFLIFRQLVELNCRYKKENTYYWQSMCY